MKITELTPPIFATRLARIDSPADNDFIAYALDSAFFKACPKRRTCIRASVSNEWDRAIPEQYRADLPRINVLVVRLSEGVHYVTPCYRTNNPFWSEPRTDADVANILAEMAKRGGADMDEMLAFGMKHCPDLAAEFGGQGNKPFVIH